MEDWKRRAGAELGDIIGDVLRGARPAAPGAIRAVANGRGAVAIGGDLHLHVRVQGEATIGDIEVAKIKGMVARIVALEGAAGAGHREVYARLQTAFRIVAVRDLPRADFASAVAYLDAWIARLRADRPKR